MISQIFWDECARELMAESEQRRKCPADALHIRGLLANIRVLGHVFLDLIRLVDT